MIFGAGACYTTYMPPPAEGFAARLVIGPALRTQPDRRLVRLVRDGYESAFEEIVRRYGRTLTRYAGAIVGGRAEDVTQDAFSKALLALRRDDAEIDLRPWLFRIVRNTALNDLRDSPPTPEALAETILGGGRSAAEEAERREELADLIERLRALPEPQRAAIVMRELEGLSHEEIAAALGLSDGGARQAIYRARQALRDGAGMLLPLPLLKTLVENGEVAATSAAGAGAGGAVLASGAAGGAGAGMAVKAGVVTAVIAGSVGTGIALQDRDQGDAGAAGVDAAAAAVTPGPAPGSTAARERSAASGVASAHGAGEKVDGHGAPRREGAIGPDLASHGPGGGGHGPHRHRGRRDHGQGGPHDGRHGPGRGPGRGVRPDDGGRGSHSGPGPGDGRHDGRRELEEEGGTGHDDGERSGRDGSGDNSGPGGHPPPPPPPPEEETLERDDTSGSGESGSGSSGSTGSEESP